MFKNILIANRGEIACRIIKTAKKMGIETHAVFHNKDHSTPHTKQADYSHEIVGPNPNQAYLDMEQLVGILKNNKIEAVHPGYGFLSENPSLPELLEQHGIAYIGPRSETVALMGDKIAALQFAKSLGLKTINGAVLDNNIGSFISNCESLNFPIILKLSGAGGGRGIRIIDDPSELSQSIKDLNKEKERNFGSSNIFAEEYISSPRHIEVQIIGDGNGNVRHLYERECSIQRRYQKIIEEAPARHLTSFQKKGLHEDAKKLASSMKYINAGTVEFLVPADDQNTHYFLEMNTRIQVEHGITEQICSIDLIEKQISIAYTKKFDFEQKDIAVKGHAIQARVCCEAVEDDFKPRTGKIDCLKLPEDSDIRIDFGIEEGHRVSSDFDSMIGKIIAHGKNRKEAIAKLEKGLSDLTVLGCETNVNTLFNLIRLESFHENEIITTNFIKQNLNHLINQTKELTDIEIAIATLINLKTEYAFSSSKARQKIFGWQNKVKPIILHDKNIGKIIIQVSQICPNVFLNLADNKLIKVESFDFTDSSIEAIISNKKVKCDYLIFKNLLHLKIEGQHKYLQFEKNLSSSKNNHEPDKNVKAEMPGTVISILSKAGMKVEVGQILMIVESMKIQTNIISEVNGTIDKIYFSENQSFERGTTLISISEA